MDVFIIVLICLIIFYGISEIFGRNKHIGRGWSFALLATSLIFGIIAIILSPSAKSKPTNGNQNHKVFGWISIVLGILNIIALNPLAVGLIVLGIYLIELSKGKVENKNPKFYFDTIPTNTNNKVQNFTKNLNNKNMPPDSSSEYSYYIIEDNEQFGPLTITELKDKKITETTYIWRKGFSDWTKASDIDELKNIITYKPPPFNPNNKINVQLINERKNFNEYFIINEKSYSLQEIKRKFENGDYFIGKNTKITFSNGSAKLLTEIPELSFILDYFPPDINSNNESI